jgi:transcriptional regulator with XRE-family HTH domain
MQFGLESRGLLANLSPMSVPSGGNGSREDASRLRSARQRAGLDLAAAAREIGYSVSHLSNVERGVKTATPHLVQAYENLGSTRPRPFAGPPRESGISGACERRALARPAARFDECGDDDRFGTRLMRLRLAQGWSLRQAARMMKISHTHLANLESGRRTPSGQTARTCDDFLAGDGSLAELAERAAREQKARRTRAVDDTPRRPEVTRLDPDTPLSELESEFERLRTAAQRDRPASLYPTIAARADALASFAADRGTGDAQSWVLAARLAELAGWMAQEAGRTRAYTEWTGTAARWAVRGGDRDMAAYAWERLSLDPFCRGDAENAIVLAQRGADTRGAGPRVRGLSLCRVAQGLAMLPGARTACLHALDGAARLLSLQPAAPDVWGSGSMPAIPAFVEAWCLIELGGYEQAAALLGPWRQTAASPRAPRTRARYAVRTAMALTGAGEDRQAAEVISELLPAAAAIDSATVRADLRNLIKLIARRRSPLLVAQIPNLRNISSH